MESAHYDIGIVGGGLAGLSSAILCADAGLKVILFEKNTYPFHRVCGEYISNESYDFVQRLGLDLAAMNLPNIDQLRVTDARGGEVTHAMEMGGFGISRYRLDESLAKLARSKGVELKEGTTVQGIGFAGEVHTVQTSHQEFTCRIVIGAQGKRSLLDKQMDREFMQTPAPPHRNYVGVKYHVQADLPKDLIELHIFKDGYCGISSIGEGDRFCMCYLTTAENLQQAGGSIERLNREVLSQNPNLKRYFEEFPVLYEKPLVISQVNFSSKSAVEQHVLMAGDSAGLITPLCGNGMSMAFQASALLSPLVTAYLAEKIDRPTLESRYKSAWNRAFNLRLTAGRTLQHLFFKEGLIRPTLHLLSKSNWLTGKLVGLTHGSRF